MTMRNKSILQAWLAEFAEGGTGGGRVHVADQEPDEGRDDGLVVYSLSNSSASIYIEPIAPGALDWCVTIEANPDDIVLSSHRVRELCQELSAAAVLCDFLQEKALAHLADESRGQRWGV